MVGCFGDDLKKEKNAVTGCAARSLGPARTKPALHFRQGIPPGRKDKRQERESGKTTTGRPYVHRDKMYLHTYLVYA